MDKRMQMPTRLFGTTQRPVAIVGQGTWPIPDVAALRHGLSLGMTHIDTAETYGKGRSEELVGEAIRGFPREQLFLVSKVLPQNGGRKKLQAACEGSLRRLGVSELDCYLLHWRGDGDLAETMEGLEQLVSQGKIRALGVSNLDPWDLREAQAALRQTSIACNQVLYNLEERTVESHELPWAQAHKSALVAYTPLGGMARYESTLQTIGERHKVPASAIALAFLLRTSDVFVIPKAATIAHVEANAQAAYVELTDEEIAAINAAAPLRERNGPLPTN